MNIKQSIFNSFDYKSKSIKYCLVLWILEVLSTMLGFLFVDTLLQFWLPDSFYLSIIALKSIAIVKTIKLFVVILKRRKNFMY